MSSLAAFVKHGQHYCNAKSIIMINAVTGRSSKLSWLSSFDLRFSNFHLSINLHRNTYLFA